MAGISVIRVSGPRVVDALRAMAGGAPTPRMAALRNILAPGTSRVIDRGLVLFMPSPHSATGEDVAEFHIHGSAAVVDAMFEALAGFPDARMAEPGEFMRRAFAHGKLDLVEIEGLADLLHARTEGQRRLAVRHMLGEASSVYEGWRRDLLAILAYLEAAIDFTEEEGVAEEALLRSRPLALRLIDGMSAALGDADRAGHLRDGIRIVFAGAPNAGKSSLLNAIARREASIVSARPGTTRDIIEVPMVLEGMPVILTDTAGIRARSGDEVEEKGIKFAQRAAAGADLCVWLTAPDVPDQPDPPEGRVLRIGTKSDLPNAILVRNRNDIELFVSATSGEGMPELLELLRSHTRALYAGTENATVVRARHKSAVENSIRMLNESLTFDSAQIELAAECMRRAAQSMAGVTGRIDVEDLLDKVFSEFCIGK